MPDKPLSRKHQLFIEEYLASFNGTRAYMKVYPSASYETAMANAAKLLGSTKIAAVVSARQAEAQMTANEALKRMADIARGDMGDIMDPTTFGYNFDMKKAKEIGFTKLIKKVKQKTITILGKGEDADDTEIHTLEIELYPADAALDKILRVHGAYKDTGEIGNALMEIVKKIGVDTDKL